MVYSRWPGLGGAARFAGRAVAGPQDRLPGALRRGGGAALRDADGDRALPGLVRERGVARSVPLAFPPRPAASKRTVTTVLIPPRMFQSPTTSMRRGASVRTRSSRMRLVTSSWNAPSFRYAHM